MTKITIVHEPPPQKNHAKPIWVALHSPVQWDLRHFREVKFSPGKKTVWITRQESQLTNGTRNIEPEQYNKVAGNMDNKPLVYM